ncbi:HAD family hydrolase [Rhodococcus sp. 14-2483-1-1]|uniref:HAD family hydrolase n=1 Tax=Nocardiaceae TaxID=85025 RepID=UPI0005686C41|nr:MULTISPECIES: HAD family hydrolase [Rhodococcus]MBJ7350599.1 HAD family hydrolase [Rhodococcus sp. (in: high G+C Gram-positive bacteria)]OZE81017.1 HAD family hydrolase [Rhodococcus sp. 15-649-2-2]OZF35443.1 HAD family hydrolase [Rhodococcus sp. 14-2483-1-1]QII02915.1 HAD family hydrolase [Rhodococcus fascians A21d2]
MRVSNPTVGAVLFDIDGTLVDSNYVHVDAWSRAFREAGHEVPSWRIHRSIGMDGSKLLEALVGSSDSAVAQEAKKLHGEYYADASSDLEVLPDARELLADLNTRGLTVVLATSAPESELSTLRDLLDVEDSVAVVTSGEDAEVAKPEPDIVAVALERAGVQAERAVMVGDSVWDIEAAGRAGVRAIGVLSGGISRSELLDAGAVAVFDDPADLLANIETSPIYSDEKASA